MFYCTRESCSWLWNLWIKSFNSSFSSDVMLRPETLPVVSVTTNDDKKESVTQDTAYPVLTLESVLIMRRLI